MSFPLEPVLVVIPECYGHAAGTYRILADEMSVESDVFTAVDGRGLVFSLRGKLVETDKSQTSVEPRSVDVIEL